MFDFFKRLQVDPKQRMRQVLGDFRLPMFPQVVMKALGKIRDPKASAREVSAIISADPGLSMQVFKIVNSAAFMTRRGIVDLTQAVAMMGMNKLESLLLSVAVGNGLPHESRQGYSFQVFWRAAMQRAAIASSLSVIVCPGRRMESFTAALLQDMAIPFLLQQQTDSYLPVLTSWRTDAKVDLAHLERSHFDWDHAEVATWICSEWSLPETISMVIGEHHGSLDLGGQCPLPVSIVNCVRDVEENSWIDQLLERALDKLNIEIEQLKDTIHQSLETAEDLYKLFK